MYSVHAKKKSYNYNTIPFSKSIWVHVNIVFFFGFQKSREVARIQRKRMLAAHCTRRDEMRMRLRLVQRRRDVITESHPTASPASDNSPHLIRKSWMGQTIDFEKGCCYKFWKSYTRNKLTHVHRCCVWLMHTIVSLLFHDCVQADKWWFSRFAVNTLD